jgi:hypothetical protein
MFEVGGHYSNRIGEYTVLEINEPRMTVQYEDGDTAELSIHIQRRIWENILNEEEAQRSRSTRTKKRRSTTTSSSFFIRSIKMLDVEQFMVPGMRERGTATEVERKRIDQGDRLIYYAIENRSFFAVATITGKPSKPTAKDQRTDKKIDEKVLYFTVDVDARITDLGMAVPFESVEFEKQSEVGKHIGEEGSFVAITEDEFEILAELLTESTEIDEDDVGAAASEGEFEE